MESTLLEKIMLRKQINTTCLAVFLYNLVLVVVVLCDSIVKFVVEVIRNPALLEQETQFDEMINQMMNSGFSSIMGILCGLIFLVIFLRRKQLRGIFQKTQTMTLKNFVLFFCVFMSAQLIFTLLANAIEIWLNWGGYTIMSAVEQASGTSMTLSMFLYAGLFGPIAEELVYRGFVLRSLQQYGKVLAIVISALLFGAMHGNLIQGVFAFGIGLVLGYVALEYSIKWTILMHILNNMVFGDLMSWLIAGLSTTMQLLISNGIIILFFIAGVIILCRYRMQIKEYITVNRVQKDYFKYTFTAVWMIIFLAVELLAGLNGIQKL